MPSIELKPRSFAAARYSRVKREKWGIELHADRAIDIYTVPVGQFEAWKRKDPFDGSAYLRKRNLKIESKVGPEFEYDWDLVLENVSEDPIDVEYEVYER